MNNDTWVVVSVHEFSSYRRNAGSVASVSTKKLIKYYLKTFPRDVTFVRVCVPDLGEFFFFYFFHSHIYMVFDRPNSRIYIIIIQYYNGVCVIIISSNELDNRLRFGPTTYTYTRSDASQKTRIILHNNIEKKKKKRE